MNDNHPMKMEDYRGIENRSGVSCHLSSAIQLLYHTMPDIRKCILLLSLDNVVCLMDDDTTNVNWNDMAENILFLNELKALFQELSTVGDETSASTAVNPGKFYSCLFQKTKKRLNADQVGDAATALRTILKTIRSSCQSIANFLLLHNNMENNKKMEVVIQSLYNLNVRMKECLDGTVLQQIIGLQTLYNRNDRTKTITKRIKPSNVRQMTHPLFPVPIKGNYTLTDALECALGHTQPIQNYNWNTSNSSTTYIETITTTSYNPSISTSSSSDDDDNDDDDDVSSIDSTHSSSSDSSSSSFSSSSNDSCENDDNWKTYNRQTFHQLPPYFVLHLKRFDYQQQQNTQILQQKCNIPLMLNLSFISSTNATSCCKKYKLVGAMAHIQPLTNTLHPEEEENFGHYITFIQKTNQPPNKDSSINDDGLTSLNLNDTKNNTVWIKMDDEDISIVDTDDILRLLSGGKDAILHDSSSRHHAKITSNGGSVCATVLIYTRTCDSHNDQQHDHHNVTFEEMKEYYNQDKIK